MSTIIDKEPDMPVIPPSALAGNRGALKILVHDPVGPPSKSGHDDWHLKFLVESIRLIPGWTAELCDDPPKWSGDPSEHLLLVTRSDGRSWPSLLARRADFAERMQCYANWVQECRTFSYGPMSGPSKLLRSQSVDWDVALKEQWASWWDTVWPSVERFGSVLERPNVVVGDEAVWAFAKPGDLVVSARGISPMGLADRLRGLLSSRPPYQGDRPFGQIDVCVGLSWAENTNPAKSGEEWQEAWGQLLEGFRVMADMFESEGYGDRGPDMADIAEGYTPVYSYAFQCPPPISEVELIQSRQYAMELVKAAARTYLPWKDLEPGEWQEPEMPNVMSPRHVSKVGSGPSVAARRWTPARAKKKAVKKDESS